MIKRFGNRKLHTKRCLKFTGFLVIFFFLFSCEKWYDTKEASHVSSFPEFKIKGGEFLSYIVADSGEYEDMGASAFSNGKSLEVTTVGEVDLTNTGIYFIRYYAENEDGISAEAERIVAVTTNSVSFHDFSGLYETSRWGSSQQMKVERLDTSGLYKCSEIFGYPGTKMPGRFVDLGKNHLVLLHGDGDFGNYSSVMGSYTDSTLNWTIYLTSGTYAGAGFSVEWKKINEE
jgi:hypothetical protein